jgi:small nuclear ribonucleoprotein G
MQGMDDTTAGDKRKPKPSIPDLKNFMNKQVQVKLRGARTVSGLLRGVDQFMNIVLHEAQEHGKKSDDEKTELGVTVIRGNVIVDLMCV